MDDYRKEIQILREALGCFAKQELGQVASSTPEEKRRGNAVQKGKAAKKGK